MSKGFESQGIHKQSFSYFLWSKCHKTTGKLIYTELQFLNFDFIVVYTFSTIHGKNNEYVKYSQIKAA